MLCVSPSPGPLLYHFADMPGELSIELSWDEVHRIAESEIGFEILVSQYKPADAIATVWDLRVNN